MTRAKVRWQQGFTMVEIIIVLVVAGILIALVLNSLQTVRAKARDAERRFEIDAIAKQLEGCYNNMCHGSYPSLAQLTDTSTGGFVATNFKDFSNDYLFDSSDGIIQGNNASAATQYQYITMPVGCTGSNGARLCTGFTLRAYQETNPDHPYVKESFNK